MLPESNGSRNRIVAVNYLKNSHHEFVHIVDLIQMLLTLLKHSYDA